MQANITKQDTDGTMITKKSPLNPKNQKHEANNKISIRIKLIHTTEKQRFHRHKLKLPSDMKF